MLLFSGRAVLICRCCRCCGKRTARN